ncbi:DUF397 domain-containing protein [Haloechinothrix sp. LS1_15]|uniref:DUF397 domain-containing protein n=1 Tax=Haloechinothrix sp. LS1_15 TaxID=2652248 RepID=UPI00294743E0|nr:DUF397 domain-containing protein [Haloechinothrix sp. LS1_15]MDV6014770.1 DUF397 domain-containing protein [Haloechinothrix sp. LS1_15]
MAHRDPSQLRWRTSSYTGSEGSCVELAPLPAGAALRDTKNRTGGILVLSDPAWQAFREGIKQLG